MPTDLQISQKIFFFLGAKRKLILRILLILIFLFLTGIWQPKTQEVLSAADRKITSNEHADDFWLEIPALNLGAPVIADVDGTDKATYFKALESGVAHFKGTAKPGENSNIFIFGHSSFYADQPGNYKQIFRHLDELKKESEIIVWYQNKKYTYLTDEIKIVEPNDKGVLKPSKSEKLTIMTCWPPGSILQRLIVIAYPV